MQEVIFGVPAGTSWAETFAARPWVGVIAVVVVVLLVVAAWWVITRKLPPADRGWTMDADAEPGRAVFSRATDRGPRRDLRPPLHRELGEKVALIALVSIIFGQVLTVRPSRSGLALIVGARRGRQRGTERAAREARIEPGASSARRS